MLNKSNKSLSIDNIYIQYTNHFSAFGKGLDKIIELGAEVEKITE